MDLEARRTLISVRLQMLIALFGKKFSDDGLESVKRVYCDALQNFDDTAITGGFKKAEQTCERFPTPKAMKDFCSESTQSGAWRYNYGKSKALDPETGKEVEVRIDPVTGELLFRAEDCPEGREFLRKFRELAGGQAAKAKFVEGVGK
jgi:hypothetical protein